MIESIGFLSMRFEETEKRDFRPQFFNMLKNTSPSLLLEKGYGERLGFHEKDYLESNHNILFVTRDEVYKADFVVSVRTPSMDELKKLKDNAIFFSMLHYLTRAKRNEFLLSKNIQMLSMDGICDDFGHRIIQDFEGTVRSAFKAAYQEYNFFHEQKMISVLVLGTGELGKIAVDMAVSMIDKPVVVTSVGPLVTKDTDIINNFLKSTDILVDASKRPDSSRYIITNDQLGLLPEHAVVVDISADDYDVNVNPIQVKGIEGIPTGNLDKYVFQVDDPAYDSIPKQVSMENRRLVIGCNAWPGVNPLQCLDKYELQIAPFICEVVHLEGKFPSEKSLSYFERALYRGTYDFFQNSGKSVLVRKQADLLISRKYFAFTQKLTGKKRTGR